MGRKYKFPLMSRIAAYLQWIVPTRTLVWFALGVLDEVDEKMKTVRIKEDDGEMICEAMTAVQLENYKRLIIREYLKGEVEQ